MLIRYRRRNWDSILNRFLQKTSFHCLLSATFVTFLIHWPLSPVASSVSRCRSCFVCSGLTITYTVEVVPLHSYIARFVIYSGGSPSTNIYCMVYYRVIAASYIRSVVVSLHTVTLLMIIRNTQWIMSSLYSFNFVFPEVHVNIV